MADGGQRLLDVIDDPNALESFLGGLTADTELLPSAETVDNVVASLARSLDDHEYEVDSPNETLFDTLDSSSNHLTDISRSYVPSDFGSVAVQNDAFANLDGFSNSSNVNRGNFSHQSEHQQTSNSDCDQFIGSSNNSSNLIDSVISAASSISNSTSVTASNLKQIAASVSNCDPSKSTNFVQSGQIHLAQNSVSSANSNCLNFNFAQELQQHQEVQQQQQLKHINVQVSTPQNQVTSLSSLTVEGQLQQNVPSSSTTNNLISAVVGSGNQNGVVHTLTDTTSNFQAIASQHQSGHTNAQHTILVSSSLNTSANVQVTSGNTSSVSNATTKNETNANNIASNNNVSLSTTTNVVGSTAAALQQAQQFIATSSAAAVNQFVTGQTVSIPSMTVSASQLLASSQAGLVAASAGQNILQQIQSAGTSQSYIAMEQPTAALIATGPTSFGTNVALLATGGTPTYAVLPTTPQFLTNAIIPQSHTIQTLTKTANGAFFQTTGTPQIVTTSNINALQNVSSAVTTNAGTATTNPVTSVSTSVESANSGTTVQQPGANTPASSGTTVTDSVVTQIIQQSQQQQQQITNVSGNTGTVAITPQQSFAIGNTAGIGQVVVSQVSNLSTMTAPQQAQFAGTIVVNQYGQPMLLPTASTTQAGALQLILRQQPAQHQVLTFQTQTGPASISAQATAQAAATGKPIVRYVSQMPQVAQTSGYGLQQIQTANGPALIAVRYPQSATQTGQFSQIQTESIVNPSTAIQSQIATAAAGQSQLQQLATAQSQSVQIQLPQQQTQQILQQASQQTAQIQLQSGLAQTHLQAQQQTAQQTLQIQTQQQISAQPSPAQSQVQQATHSGQIVNAQLQQQTTAQSQMLQQSHISQPVYQQPGMVMDTQSTVHNSPAQGHFGNAPSQTASRQQTANQSQTHAQLSRDTEQQQVSVPDSSSEPPPPKKAKTKSKSSKKKVTLDLEQLLKQSGIMDEDLNDMNDMNFDFSFAMDPPSNGLPPSPQVPPAQIPVINTTETPKKSSSKKSKSNAKKSTVQQTPPAPPPPVVPPPPPPPVVTASPSAKPSKKKSSPKKKNAPAPPPPVTPPPPPVVHPPPPPIVTTPTSSKSKSSKKKAGGSGNNATETPKPETSTTPSTPKTGSSKKKDAPPKKISSLDTLLATIEAVAAAAGASSSPTRVSPPPPFPTTPSARNKPTPSPKSKKSKKKSASSVPEPAKTEPLLLPPVSLPSSNPLPPPPPPVNSSLPASVSAPSLIYSQSQPLNSIPNNAIVTTPNSLSAATSLASSLNALTPAPRATGPNMSMTNGSTSVSTSQTGLTRVVQTIQLTPQNQQLLRNIQSQIQKLCALPKRNESEQQALQKLVVLQQQVIATGIPVPNPAHLNNLAQSVNVESINLATPCTSVPSDTVTASSSSSANLVSPSAEIDLNLNPVSSSVVTSAALSVLANLNVSNSLKHTANSKLASNNVSSSPQQVAMSTAASATGSLSNNSGTFIVGSPSVSSAASPDSTSNHTNNLTVEQCTTVPSSNNTAVANTTSSASTPHPPSNTAAANFANSSAGVVGNVVVSNVKADLGQLVASVSMPSSEDVNKENTHGKSSQGVPMAPPAVPVSAPPASNSNVSSFSQHISPVSLPGSYVPASFSTATRPAVDEKKLEEQRLATLKAEEEKRARWKKEEFEMLLQRDQQYVVKPDYEIPFGSKKDAVERLMKYHIYRDRNDMNFEDFDMEFGNNAGILLDKFSVMLSKYRTLLLKESMKEVGCAERVMLERMFVSEEKVRLEQDRLLVAQGDVMELPPPPQSWVPKIKEMVDKEMMEFEPQDPVVSQQVQSAVDSIIGCESEDINSYMLEDGDKIEYDAFGVPINSSGYAGLSSASSADIDEAVRSILT